MKFWFFNWASPLMPDIAGVVVAPRCYGVQIGGFQFCYWTKMRFLAPPVNPAP